MKIKYNCERECWESKENGKLFSYPMGHISDENLVEKLVFISFEDFFDYFDLEEEFYELLNESE